MANPWFENKLVVKPMCRGCSKWKPSVTAVQVEDEQGNLHWTNIIKCQHRGLCDTLESALNEKKENA